MNASESLLHLFFFNNIYRAKNNVKVEAFFLFSFKFS